MNRSKKVKLALEIETGALVSEKGVEKRTYMFTSSGIDDKVLHSQRVLHRFECSA